jgi:hypothetical protein
MFADRDLLMVKPSPVAPGNEEATAFPPHEVGQRPVQPCRVHEVLGLHVAPKNEVRRLRGGVVVKEAKELPHELRPAVPDDPEPRSADEIKVNPELAGHDYGHPLCSPLGPVRAFQRG